MAKGLGAIYAQIAKQREQSAIDKNEKPVCPLCGTGMTLEMGGWFCRSAPPDNTGVERPCISKFETEIRSAFCHADDDNWIDDWQGATIAAIVINGKPAIELHTTRGGFGRTNLRLSSYKDDQWIEVSDKDMPIVISENEWIWMDWAYPFSYQE